jgi:hypothetical protein
MSSFVKILNRQGEVDQCVDRAIYKDSDWGVTAYFTIYGIQSRAEAEAIAKFMIDARKKNGQEKIPINLQVFSVSRSSGPSSPSQYKILDRDF